MIIIERIKGILTKDQPRIPKTQMLVLYPTLLLFLLADVITTSLALSYEAVEGNPIMRCVVYSPLLHTGVKLVFFAIVWLIASHAATLHPLGEQSVIISAVVFCSLPVINNLYQLFTLF